MFSAPTSPVAASQRDRSTLGNVELLDSLLAEAATSGASDVHVEPMETALRVRMRVDGHLVEAASLPASRSEALAARVKVLAGLDLAEKRRPQDGRMAFQAPPSPGREARSIDVRVSTLPTRYGEKVVMRLLDRERLPLDFAALGLGEGDRATLTHALDRPHGLVLVTGPTGSGKTTTLYAALSYLNRTERNLLTVEDPVEYELAGVSQTGVRADIGLTFASVLRAQLRQDPDVIMVGEIRDGETAQIAVRAALTGHLVLSTLHTNDAPSTVSRLLDVGIEPFLVASALRLVVAQRLVRTVCPDCAGEREPTPGEDESLDLAGAPVAQAVGCEQCRNTGYRGRAPILELMPMSEEISALVGRRAPTSEVRDAAARAGMRSLRDSARALVLNRTTTPHEAIQATY